MPAARLGRCFGLRVVCLTRLLSSRILFYFLGSWVPSILQLALKSIYIYIYIYIIYIYIYIYIHTLIRGLLKSLVNLPIGSKVVPSWDCLVGS